MHIQISTPAIPSDVCDVTFYSEFNSKLHFKEVAAYLEGCIPTIFRAKTGKYDSTEPELLALAREGRGYKVTLRYALPMSKVVSLMPLEPSSILEEALDSHFKTAVSHTAFPGRS